MAATGEECFHQRPIHEYFAFGYGKTFDSATEHNCDYFHVTVIPDQRCGTCCPAFRPLTQVPTPEKSMSGSPANVSRREAQVRLIIQQQVKDVCAEIERNTDTVERQVKTREQQYQETDAWLSRPDTQREVLDQALVTAEQDLSRAQIQVKQVCQQLEFLKTQRQGSEGPEQLWLKLESAQDELQTARETQRQAQLMLAARAQKEAEHGKLFARWEYAVTRVSLLRRLCVGVLRYVEYRLEDRPRLLNGTDFGRLLGYLKQIQAYSRHDVPNSKLQGVVEKLEQRTSAT